MNLIDRDTDPPLLFVTNPDLEHHSSNYTHDCMNELQQEDELPLLLDLYSYMARCGLNSKFQFSGAQYRYLITLLKNELP